MNYVIYYRTRDANGKDFIKEVKIKKYEKETKNFICPICKKEKSEGIKSKKIVSSKFTDWTYIDDYICENCADLFSIYFYNYVLDDDGIHLYNVRELEEQLTKQQKLPFMFVISTTQKKHLFYRSKWNYNADSFFVNLETETIYTTPKRMKQLFDFVCCLQTLGANKGEMKNGEIRFDVLKKTGFSALEFLQNELIKSREIQIPLYCGQKREISEEEARCCIISILKA